MGREPNGNGPILLASAVVIEDGRVLLTRHEGSPAWHLPDGLVRFGETARACLRRSLAEDLGLAESDVAPAALQPVHVSETIRLPQDRHYVTLHYKVGLSPRAAVRPRAGLEVMRVPPSKALGMTIFESTRAALVSMGYVHLDG